MRKFSRVPEVSLRFGEGVKCCIILVQLLKKSRISDNGTDRLKTIINVENISKFRVDGSMALPIRVGANTHCNTNIYTILAFYL